MVWFDRVKAAFRAKQPRVSAAVTSAASTVVELARVEAARSVALESISSIMRSMGSMTASDEVAGGDSGFVVPDTAHRGASQTSRALRSWAATAPVDGNLETVYDLAALRARSADLCRNNPIARGAVNRRVQKTIGVGLTVHPAIDRDLLGLSDDEADAWEREVKALFDKVAGSTDLDVRRTETFYGLQELAFRSSCERGEVFALLPLRPRRGTLCDLRVQLVEADRVTNPHYMFDTFDRMAGIAVDVDGAPVSYSIETTPSWLNVQRTWMEVPAFGPKSGRPNVLHVYKQQRVADKRGIPMLSPVIDTLKQITRYTEAELMATVISSFYTVFIKSLTGDDDPVGGLVDGESEPADGAQAKPLPPMKMGPGMINTLAEGEDISTADPNRPNPNYEPFVNAHIRQIGMAVDTPYEVLVQHFSASYSAARAALIEMWDAVLTWRSWFAARFCQPIWEEWLAEMVASGRIAAPGFFASEELRRAWCAALWIGAAMPQIDPVKETDAAAKKIKNGLSTMERESRALNGSDWEKNFRQRAKEEGMRKSLGLDFDTNINPITGDDDGRSDNGVDEDGDGDGNDGSGSGGAGGGAK